jgi:ParB-like chromosome segregation protein Spo0J
MEKTSENVVEIPLKKIIISGRLLRKATLMSRLELEEILRAYDRLQPITVAPKGETYRLMSGVHRYKAAKRLRMKTVKAVVTNGQRSSEKDVRKTLGDSVEKALLIARYARLFWVPGKGGRPRALSSEKVEKAKEMRKQGKSFREIGFELGVGRSTVRCYLVGNEGLASTGTVKPAAKPFSGIRSVAKRLGFSSAFIIRCLQVEKAVRKYPSLRRLRKMTHVIRMTKLADTLQATEDCVKAAVDMILERKIAPEDALRFACNAITR